MFIVGIPYLPQVYDEIWDATFKGSDWAVRDAAPQRIQKWCAERNISYVKTLDSFRTAVKKQGRWLHHSDDAHPTAEGHTVIAEAVKNANVINAASPKADDAGVQENREPTGADKRRDG